MFHLSFEVLMKKLKKFDVIWIEEARPAQNQYLNSQMHRKKGIHECHLNALYKLTDAAS